MTTSTTTTAQSYKGIPEALWTPQQRAEANREYAKWCRYYAARIARIGKLKAAARERGIHPGIVALMSEAELVAALRD